MTEAQVRKEAAAHPLEWVKTVRDLPWQNAVVFRKPASPAAVSRAATFPAGPVRFVVGFTPGGPSDILARALGQKLAERFGQPVVIENRPGAGGNLAAEAVANSAPDGHTWLLGNNSILATNQSLYRSLPYDPVKDFAPVALVAIQPNILVVHPGLPASSVSQLISYLKNNPGKVNYASSGSGAAAHLAGELFKAMAGVDIVHVPYKGAQPALTDVIAGQVQMMFATSASVIPYVKAGRLRALAVTTAQRSASVPELPTIAEAGVPGFEATTWHGVVVPAATPADLVEALNKKINSALEEKDLKDRLNALGAEIATGTPKEFADYIAREIPKWAKVVKDSGAKPE
jgi:tripartite-type tricarboxylate transporter receptor subunit TctC